MSGYYDQLVQKRVIERELNYRGQTKPVYFRPLTAGERAAVSRGHKIGVNRKSDDQGYDVDAGDIIDRTHKFLAYCNVTADGSQIFRNALEVAKLPEDLVNKLNLLATEALEEDSEETEGDTVKNS